jgi:hypothetical protein
MHSSAIHDPYAGVTAAQISANAAHNKRRAAIAARAVSEGFPRALSFTIPNAPFGVPKIRPYTVTAPKPVFIYRMWFDDLVDDAMRAIRPSRAIQVKDIQAVCAGHYRVKRADITGPRRTANMVRPRQVAMCLSKTMIGKSLPEIGRLFGGRDHTTALHAVRKISALAERDPALAAEIDKIKASIAERVRT